MEAENTNLEELTIRYEELLYGEKYTTTEKHTYSNYDDVAWPLVDVPKAATLLFRSFQEYGYKQRNKIALFYWLENKISVCLLVSEETPLLYLERMIEERND